MPGKDQELKEQIEAVHRQHPAYGHRRVAMHLRINHKRTQRVMALFDLRPPRRRLKRYSTVSTSHHSYRNQLASLLPITKTHQAWCSDLSHFSYRGSSWYLATIEDVATRQLVAQQVGKRHDSQLVLTTLKQAFERHIQPAIFHSDQGSEFMAERCTDYLEQRGVQVSVSDVASPWQNGYQESFFGRFKDEFGDPNRFDSTGAFIAAIYQHAHYYNYHRIHTALKMPPAVYARTLVSDLGLHKTGT